MQPPPAGSKIQTPSSTIGSRSIAFPLILSYDAHLCQLDPLKHFNVLIHILFFSNHLLLYLYFCFFQYPTLSASTFKCLAGASPKFCSCKFNFKSDFLFGAIVYSSVDLLLIKSPVSDKCCIFLNAQVSTFVLKWGLHLYMQATPPAVKRDLTVDWRQCFWEVYNKLKSYFKQW